MFCFSNYLLLIYETKKNFKITLDVTPWQLIRISSKLTWKKYLRACIKHFAEAQSLQPTKFLIKTDGEYWDGHVDTQTGGDNLWVWVATN